jgi:exodeoxyribonuclease V alpha subunit
MTSTISLVQLLKKLAIFGAPEDAATDLIQRRSEVTDDLVLTALGLAIWAHRNGHPCVHLGDVGGLVGKDLTEDDLKLLLGSLPPVAEFMNALDSNPTVVRKLEKGGVGTYLEATSDLRPLVLVGDLLFTQRQFADELSIAEQLAMRATKRSAMIVDTSLINRLVPKPEADDEEAIKVGDTGIANRAAQSVVSNCLTVLTGGPGTGKTFTLTRCLAVLLSARESELDDLSIALIAPTGKAAARASELLNSFVSDERDVEKPTLGVSEKVLNALLKIEPKTIQRALGNKRRMHTRFQHDHRVFLPHDIVIIDEMSMVASYLMARLLEAIRPDSTILLVGDQAQLESVESGSVLRDVVDASTVASSPLDGRVYELLRVWRQTSETRIGDLARHIRAGEADKALSLAVSNPAGVMFVESKKKSGVSEEVIGGTVVNLQTAASLAVKVSQADHQNAYQLIANNKVLCGPRNGKLGVETWNLLIGKAVHGASHGDLFNPGTPLLVTVNSPRSRLVNGDIGVVVNYQDVDGTVNRRVFFYTEEGGRYLTPAELPQVEICYAMTVHKSQGSEYENLVFILPGEDSPLLTRELVYTAVTRAKKSLAIAGSSEAFVHSINNQSTRYSGLKTLLSSV